MSEQSRPTAEWQSPPRRYGKITNDELAALDGAAERFTFICYLGCGGGAILALTLAAIAWADPIAAALGVYL